MFWWFIPPTHGNISDAGFIIALLTLVDNPSLNYSSMGWFKGKFTGNPHIEWENLMVSG